MEFELETLVLVTITLSSRPVILSDFLWSFLRFQSLSVFTIFSVAGIAPEEVQIISAFELVAYAARPYNTHCRALTGGEHHCTVPV